MKELARYREDKGKEMGELSVRMEGKEMGELSVKDSGD